ncbi:Probable nucleoredoxin 1 [Striga hermonthica]|uniref:protein-disulfide reductase n=1 Tax=Striga hermonthica TaxID=68872 RepID=A0A9N7NJK6_STRHE|nr:Probable nucleoredoxin 1 [Striga hermonthica]
MGSSPIHSAMVNVQVKISDVEGKIVAVYFSANWCLPCHQFTKALTNAYEQLKDRGFEIVFVSSDEDQCAFDEYRALMPWPAIPFSDMGTKRALSRKFDVESIPCLVILEPDGDKDSTIVDGVDLIYQYGAQAYPFTKDRLDELMRLEKEKHENQTLHDLLTNRERDFLLSNSNPKQVPVTSLTGKTIGLYFSAQWCSPAMKFTPKLASIYRKINQETGLMNGTKSFEIVLVSSDHSQTCFDSYFGTMPWLALPYGDPNIKKLAKYFDVRGIPSLVILGTDGKTVTKSGRNLVNLYLEKAYPFTGDRIELLTRQADEEAKKLPESEYHSGHQHELTLVSEGNGGGRFICCDCEEQGAGWAYQCIGCGYEVHPKCVRTVCKG